MGTLMSVPPEIHRTPITTDWPFLLSTCFDQSRSKHFEFLKRREPPPMAFTPQIETVQMSDAELDTIAGGQAGGVAAGAGAAAGLYVETSAAGVNAGVGGGVGLAVSPQGVAADLHLNAVVAS